MSKLSKCLNCGQEHTPERAGNRLHCYRSDYCPACNLKGDQACLLLSQLFGQHRPRPDGAAKIYNDRVEQYAAKVAAGERLFEGRK